MSRRSVFIAAGIAAFLVFLVAMVPAVQLANRLPTGIVMTGVGGTVWSGRAEQLVIEGTPLGAIEWSCRPWALLRLEWSCGVGLFPAGGEVRGDVSGEFDGHGLVGQDVTGRLPIATFEGITPRGWQGMLELDVDVLQVVDRRPAEARGTLVLRGLKAPGPAGQPLGDFELTMGEGAVGTGALAGRLRDLGGPLRVRGALELHPDGSYLLSGETAPGPGAGPAIFDTLAFLGPPDSLGRRPFTIEGSL